MNVILVALFFIIATAGLANYPIYATWLMIWNGSDQSHWWKPTDYLGATNFLGKYKSIDWTKEEFIRDTIEAVKRAGIKLLILDLTNGWVWLNQRVLLIQKLCQEMGLKICIAENSNGDVKTFEEHCKDIWNLFAGPDAPYSSTYFRKEGKPVIVCYAIRQWFNAYRQSEGEYRSKFHLVWASGEDSDINKWGWQLEPWVGPMPSEDVVFVTPSVKWRNEEEFWRSSIAWLDYTFKLGLSKKPNIVVVGSFDDIAERNAWIPCDTTNCSKPMQMRDIWGRVNFNFYYRRVVEWINGSPSIIEGGVVSDGCYQLVASDGKLLDIADRRGKPGTNLVLSEENSLFTRFMLYHLGGNIYRIISPNFGLALEALREPSGSQTVHLWWNNEGDAQRWRVTRSGSFYRFVNLATGKPLSIEGQDEWKLVKIFGIRDGR
ncbi:RICIN domain-containing protein [bacterium]|nr:RICIN domain-containing protein [bacterium]